MICPCKGCENRTVTCHGTCKGYTEWKAWKAEQEETRKKERPYYDLSHDQEMKYRKNLRYRRNTK